MLLVHEQATLISSSLNETRLVRYVHERFALSLYYPCSANVFVLTSLCKQQALVKVSDIWYFIFQHLDALHIACVLILFSRSQHKQLNSGLKSIALVKESHMIFFCAEIYFCVLSLLITVLYLFCYRGVIITQHFHSFILLAFEITCKADIILVIL